METIEITRNRWLSLIVGACALGLALAFLIRGDGVLDLVLGVLLLALAAAQLHSAWDARLPLLIADEQGVRLRLGRTWAGLPWTVLDEVEHLPRTSWLRDGRLVLLARDEEAVVATLPSAGRRQAAFTERLYGAPFVLPLGLNTTVSHGSTALSSRLADLSRGVTTIVEIDPTADEVDPALEPSAETASEGPSETTAERPAIDLGSRSGVSALRAGTAGGAAVTETVVTEGANALKLDPGAGQTDRRLPESEELFHAFDPFDGEWAGIAAAVEEDGAPEQESPVTPVIGPVIQAARTNLGLTLEQLSERSRIRTRILASIERDDFAACGGDFYARGHLRTVCRVLGIDVEPLLAQYDELYADAPVDPLQLFDTDRAKADRADRGAFRRRGGRAPNWSVLVAAVMSVVLLWSIARLVFDGASPDTTPSIGLSGGSAGTTDPYGKATAAVPVVVTAAGGGAEVVVRNSSGDVVFSGDLTFGQSKTVKVAPPVRVQSSDGSLTVSVDGAKAKAVGETGVAGQRIYAGTHD